MVRFLTARGANVNAPDARGCTPLHVAYEFGRHDLVRALLACGANPRAVDHQGRTPEQASDPADADDASVPASGK
jgi:Arf-GAP/coiled-coil/ANK repeat/PH domain-containing protein